MTEQPPIFTRKQISFIFKIAFLEAMALSIIMPTTFSTGEILGISGCNNPSSLEQCGTGSCIPTNSGGPIYACTITVIFNPAFLSVPKYASAHYAGCTTTICHSESNTVPTGSVTFQADNGETWTSMPIATTELYGNSNHEASVPNTAGNLISAGWMVNCLLGSNSATAILRPQYSSDGGVTWHELAQSTGLLDIHVDENNCGFASSRMFSVGPAGIATVAQTTNPLLLRIVGFNGGGVGDNPIFNNITLIFYASYTNSITTCIQINTGFDCAGSIITKTQMVIVVSKWGITTSGSATAIQVNWIVSE